MHISNISGGAGMPILNNSLAQFIITASIGLLAVLAATLIPIYIYRRQKNRKEIMYQVISDAPIASINEEVKDRVKILFDSNPVTDMNLLVLKAWNSGSVAVKRDDFDEPITFVFGGRKVVSSDILSADPTNLIDLKDIKSYLILGEESVGLQKFLLNPKETITIKVLLTGPAGRVIGRARIVDGKISEFNPKNQLIIVFGKSQPGVIFAIVAVIILIVSLLFSAFLPSSPSTGTLSSGLSYFLVFAIVLSITSGFLSIYEFIKAGGKR
jgi:hypothetical protein